MAENEFVLVRKIDGSHYEAYAGQDNIWDVLQAAFQGILDNHEPNTPYVYKPRLYRGSNPNRILVKLARRRKIDR